MNRPENGLKNSDVRIFRQLPAKMASETQENQVLQKGRVEMRNP